VRILIRPTDSVCNSYNCVHLQVRRGCSADKAQRAEKGRFTWAGYLGEEWQLPHCTQGGAARPRRNRDTGTDADSSQCCLSIEIHQATQKARNPDLEGVIDWHTTRREAKTLTLYPWRSGSPDCLNRLTSRIASGRAQQPPRQSGKSRERPGIEAKTRARTVTAGRSTPRWRQAVQAGGACLVLPEPVETIRRQLRISDRVLNVVVSHVMLNCSGALPIIGEFKSA
jgi:hypothetical protein